MSRVRSSFTVMTMGDSVLLSFSVTVAVFASLPAISILVMTPTNLISSAWALPLNPRREAATYASIAVKSTIFFMSISFF